MLALLQQAVKAGLLRSLDLQFARLVANEDNPLLALIAACLSADAGVGNVCFPLHRLTPELLFSGRNPALAAEIWQCAGEPDVSACFEVLQASPAVSDGSLPTPLVLQKDRLYLQRMWQDEGHVAAFLLQENEPVPVASERLRDILNVLFSESQFDEQSSSAAEPEINWQKVAAAVAATRRIAVISGGPGTGKTTTVARLLAALIRLSPDQKLRIQLAAPTGKAAARLTESLSSAVRGLGLSESELALLPDDASTLHRLLGAQPNSLKLRYHAGNPLHLDVLVVDEASMVDLPMMARLIAALPVGAQLILLGDRDQLASVEAGAVLGDICRFAEYGFSPERATELSQLTGYVLAGRSEESVSVVRDSLCLLKKSYRFDASSGIGQLAFAVNKGDGAGALSCFDQGYGDITFRPLKQSDDYLQLLQVCVEGYRHYLQCVQRDEEAGVILAAFSHFQLLCAVREGAFGVSGLNERIEQALVKARLIHKESGAAGRWYSGRPIMIGRNDSSLGLFNGDIGIALRNAEGDLRIYFQLPDGSIKSVQPSRLPEHDTAYAMTVHKSQGSEFEHTLLVLPDGYLPLLTRELVYTAITRARKRLTLFAVEKVLVSAIKMQTERRSGLVERLN